MKEWFFYDRSDIVSLYPEPLSSHFHIDPFRADHDAFPLFKYAQAYHMMQKPGDLVFIPAGQPHAVMNHEDIHGISMNYADGSNYHLYLWEMLRQENWRSFELFTNKVNAPLNHELKSGDKM